MSNYQFQMYEILRTKERLSEKGGSSKTKSVKRVLSKDYKELYVNISDDKEDNATEDSPDIVIKGKHSGTCDNCQCYDNESIYFKANTFYKD
jgi:hypothetical protein